MAAITGNQVTVDATVGGVAIIAADQTQARDVVIKNNDGTATNTVILGPSGVTTTTGYVLAGGASINFRLKAGQSLYGIRGTANSVVVTYIAN